MTLNTTEQLTLRYKVNLLVDHPSFKKKFHNGADHSERPDTRLRNIAKSDGIRWWGIAAV